MVVSQHSEASEPEQVTSMDHRILLVDDNKINQKIASLHIKDLGYKFDIANDGEEAVQMFKSGEYDLVLNGLYDASKRRVYGHERDT